MKRAKHCHECRYMGDQARGICWAGHRPRFYQPKTLRAAIYGDWGWKRRCSDFEKLKTK